MNEESGDIKMGLCCLGIKAAIVSNSPIQSTFLERMYIFGQHSGSNSRRAYVLQKISPI
jgi:hypothetical protein